MVDAPGVGDTRHNEQEGMDILQIRIKEAMLLSPEGYDVFLYVIKYGDRFRQEDVKVLESLKTIFGPDFVRTRCILILTGGDSFEKDRRDHRKTFEEWCQAEVGDFGTLLRECDNRIVLFDNMTEDETKKIDQLARLFSQIENLKERNQNERYTDNNFETAKAQRSENVDRQHKILTKVSLLLQKLQEQKGKYNQGELLKLSSDCSQVLLSIQKQNNVTHFWSEIIQKLEDIRNSLQEVFRLHSLNFDTLRRGEECDMEMTHDAERTLDAKIDELESIYCICRKEYVKEILKLVGFSLCAIAAISAPTVMLKSVPAAVRWIYKRIFRF